MPEDSSAEGPTAFVPRRVPGSYVRTRRLRLPSGRIWVLCETGAKPDSFTPAFKLPRLDSNQQPFD